MLYEFVHPRKHITEVPFYKLLPSDDIELVEEHLDEFFTTMFERQEIWYKRNIGEAKRPWTKDQYLGEYRFTNVYRELDRSSQFLLGNVTSLKKSLEEIVFQTMVYRYFNKPNCFEDGHVELPAYDGFDPVKLWEQVVTCREKHYNPWHTAYMSNLVWAKKENFKRGLLKDLAYCQRLFPIFHENAPRIADLLRNGVTPAKLMKALEKLPSISRFMSHELALDFSYLNKYSEHHKVDFDENSFTNVGPGASLGIKLIFPSLEPKNQVDAIYILRDVAAVRIEELGLDFKYVSYDREDQTYTVDSNPNLTLHQIEMWLCEYSKYVKMRWGLGKQRTRY